MLEDIKICQVVLADTLTDLVIWMTVYALQAKARYLRLLSADVRLSLSGLLSEVHYGCSQADARRLVDIIGAVADDPPRPAQQPPVIF